jgi:hypothetical protein
MADDTLHLKLLMFINKVRWRLGKVRPIDSVFMIDG